MTEILHSVREALDLCELNTEHTSMMISTYNCAYISLLLLIANISLRIQIPARIEILFRKEFWMILKSN